MYLVSDKELKNQDVFVYKMTLGGGKGDVFTGIVPASDYEDVEDFRRLMSVYMIGKNTLEVIALKGRA